MRCLMVGSLVLLLAACHQSRSSDPLAALDACRLRGVDSALRCGQLDLAEDAAQPAGRHLSIGFVVAPAIARNKLPDAVFVFAGGPGQAATEVAAQVMPLFQNLNKRRDIVFVDQRGTGRSHALTCKALDGLPLAQAVDPQVQTERLRDCWKTLDADTKFYTTEIAMRDLDAVRARLGYARIDMWGGSYGTRAALDYLRQFAPHVRVAILDGVAPADMALPASMAVDASHALAAARTACAADADCARAYPTFGATAAGGFDDWLDGLAHRPAQARVIDPVSGLPVTVPITRDSVLSAVRGPLYAPQYASLLPQALQSAQAGEYGALVTMAGALSTGLEDQFAFGMHLSVVCAEDVPQLDAPAHAADLAAARASLFGMSNIDAYRRMCEQWPVGRPSAAFYAPPSADVPVLLLSGGLDPVTPPRHAERVAQRLPQALHLIAPNAGHGVSGAGCAPDLIERFIRAGSLEGLDGSCLAAMPRPPFVLPVRPHEKTAP